MTGPTTPSVEQAAQFITARWPHAASVGLILGSGLSDVAALIQQPTSMLYAEIPGFLPTSAAGHAGQLICGKIGEVPVAVLQGRCHLYEGHSAQALMFPVHVLRALGIQTLIVTNASGGLNPHYQPGDVMVIRDQLVFQPLRGMAVTSALGRPTGDWAMYDEQLADETWRTALRLGIPAHQGTYAAVLGPNYETRAEYRMFRQLGADVVGMSTAIETITAARLGCVTLGLSIVANVARPDAPQVVTHEQVLAAVESAAGHVRALIAAQLPQLDNK